MFDSSVTTSRLHRTTPLHRCALASTARAQLLLSAVLAVMACQPPTEDKESQSDFEAKAFDLPPQSQLAPLFGKGHDAKVVVSLSFDDGFASQRTFLDILDEHDIDSIHGTFYLNSSRLNLEINERESRDHVRFGDLDMWFEAARRGHEIGSHTITHDDLSCTPTRFDDGDCQAGHEPLTDEERRRQICGDREILQALGFDVRGFAYPFGRHQYAAGGDEIHDIVSGCGFSYARAVHGLARGAYDDDDGYPLAETVPPEDNFAIRSYESLTIGLTFEDVKSWIMDAYDNGGGWVPLIMHQVSDTCEDPEVPGTELGVCTRTSELERLVQWLDRSGDFEDDGAPKDVYVRTIGQVMAEVGNLVTLEVANGGLEQPHSGSISRPNCFDRFEGKHEGNFEWAEVDVPVVDEEDGSASEEPAKPNHFEKLIPTDSHPTPITQMTTRDDRCYLGVSAGGRYQLRVRARARLSTSRVARGRFVVKLLHLLPGESGVDRVWENWALADQPVHEIGDEWGVVHLNLPPIPEGAVAIAFGFQYLEPSERVDDHGEIWLDDFELRQYR